MTRSPDSCFADLEEIRGRGRLGGRQEFRRLVTCTASVGVFNRFQKYALLAERICSHQTAHYPFIRRDLVLPEVITFLKAVPR
jgi:hypothetical protein